MQSRILLSLTAALVCAVFTSSTQAQPTAFSYQGSLNDSGSPANGFFDIFTELWDAPSGGAPVGTAITNTTVEVVDGVFTVTLDFGAAVFDGNDRWLEIGVVTNGGGAFSTLSPRQPILSVPYAIQAANAASAEAVSGTVDASQLTGAISSSNIGAGSITSVQLANGAVGTEQLADDAVTAAKIVTTSASIFTQTFTNPTPQDFDRFGTAISGVGTDKVLIGTPSDDAGSINSGVAYLHDTNGVLLTTYTNPTPANSDGFGSAVSGVASDKVLIGAAGDNLNNLDAGVAYLYDISGALLNTYINPSPASGDSFGSSVSGVGNDKVLIAASGAFEVYLYDFNGTLLTNFTSPTLFGGDGFGNAVSGVGSDKVLIGGFRNDTGAPQAGAAYLFDLDGTLLTTYTNPSPAELDWFGEAVSGIGSDKVLIGARRDDTGAANGGAAYLYDLSGTLLTTYTNPTPADGDEFGRVVSGVGNDKVLIGAYADDTGATNAGTAYLYDLSGTLLATYTNPIPAVDDRFGGAVSGVGADKVLIGASGDNIGAFRTGAAYLYTLTSYTPGLVAEGVAPGSITSLQIADGGVTSADIADGTITTDDLGSNVLSGAFWRLDGNAGTIPGTHFLGTTDNQPLQLQVNNEVALRLEYPTTGTLPNLVGGYSGNSVAAGTEGAVISGGGASGDENTIGVNSDYSTIGGGQNNNISSNSSWATIGGGLANDIGAGSQLSFIGGGLGNNIASNALGSIIAGGLNNDIGANSDGSFIGGGSANDISDSSDYATIAGGRNNGVGAGASYAFAAGWRAKANHQGAFVWADSQNADFASSANNQFNVRATGGIRLETAGSGMTIDGVSVSVITDTVPAGALIGTYGNALTMNNLANQFSGQFSGRFQGDGADTAASPSHTFDGDDNTGMFRAAENVVAFATIGTERMRITSSGDVGIGTSAPEGDLHVRGGDGVGSLIVTPGTADSDSQLLLSENTSASIGGILRYDGSANQIQILGWNNDANTATHVVVGRNNGQVGIGTGNNSVDARLHVEAVNARVAKFDRWGSDGQLVAWAKDDGVVGDVTVAAGVVSYNAFTGSHYAWTEAVMERGTLVTMTGQNRLPEEDGEVIYGVTPTSRANDPACLGAYLAPHPGLDRADSGPQHQIMSVGNGEMWVTQGSAGDIAPGDPLISSEVTGCAMKHDPDRFPVGYVCARAAEEVRWQHVPTGADGLKRVRISVLFESFVLDGRGAGIAGLMDTLRTRDLRIARLEERLQRLEEMLLPRMKGSVE